MGQLPKPSVAVAGRSESPTIQAGSRRCFATTTNQIGRWMHGWNCGGVPPAGWDNPRGWSGMGVAKWKHTLIYKRNAGFFQLKNTHSLSKRQTLDEATPRPKLMFLDIFCLWSPQHRYGCAGKITPSRL